MESIIRILHLEDMESDAELVHRALKKSSLKAELLLVDNRPAFVKALSEFKPDIILSDHSLPSFDSHEALRIYRASGIDIPFILITATISEEFAVEIMKEGACDYILKDRMERLPNAIIGAIERYKTERERKKFMDEVIANESLMREAESLAKFGSWQIDLISNMVKWSPQIYNILGYAPSQEVQPSLDNFMKVLHSDDIEKTKTSLDDAINHYDPVKINFRIIGPDKVVKYCHLEMVTQRDAQFKPLKIVGFIQDVTRIKLAENEIKLLNESLERKIAERTAELTDANRDLEAFNYSISHDLRNPIQVINGFASIMLTKYKKDLNDDAQDLLRQIKSYTKQMGQLLNDLLNFSHSGRQLPMVNETNMNQLVKEVIGDLEKMYGTINAKLMLGELANAYCDSGLTKQVWINLISNAIKYSSKQDAPVIEIGCTRLNDEIVYYVKDNGAGFSMEHAGQLFQVFNRLHTAQEFEGSGVGLAIVHRIVSKHGGRIWAESSEGNGAAFYFTLAQPMETRVYLNQDTVSV